MDYKTRCNMKKFIDDNLNSTNNKLRGQALYYKWALFTYDIEIDQCKLTIDKYKEYDHILQQAALCGDKDAIIRLHNLRHPTDDRTYFRRIYCQHCHGNGYTKTEEFFFDDKLGYPPEITHTNKEGKTFIIPKLNL